VDGRAADRQLQSADRQAREQATIQYLLACSVGMISDDGATVRLRTAIQRRRPRHDDTDQLISYSATVQPHGISRAMEAKAATGSSCPPQIPGG
jgi:hypothetical protein